MEIRYTEKDAGRILGWKVQVGHQINVNSVIAEYVIIGDAGEVKDEKRCRLKSEISGTLRALLVAEGQTVKSGDLLARLDACSHPTVWRNMCAECGEDLREAKTLQASVAMEHSIPDLLVSQKDAHALGREDEQRLHRNRKLVLLVDLDQTLIHTTNDNIPANLKDVHHFQLPHIVPGSGTTELTWYHTRLRPCTQHFLSAMSQLYELHICTFGARAYAHAIARILDPNSTLFASRILSRDECFHPTLKTSNLKALFPCGDSMVCIIDDREDVWKFAPNMVPVRPYRFFDGTADINAPPEVNKATTPNPSLVDPLVSGITVEVNKTKIMDRKSRIIRVRKNRPKATESCNTTNQNQDVLDLPVSARHKHPVRRGRGLQGVGCTAGGTSESCDVKAESQKPVAVVKGVVRGSEGEAGKEEGEEGEGEGEWEELVEWEDLDDYLAHLEDILRRIHIAYYNVYDELKRAGQEDNSKDCTTSKDGTSSKDTAISTPVMAEKPGNIDTNSDIIFPPSPTSPLEISPSKSSTSSSSGLETLTLGNTSVPTLPDLKTIVPYVRRKVLKGANILFSGVCPLNQPLHTCAIYRIAVSLGVKVHTAFVAPQWKIAPDLKEPENGSVLQALPADVDSVTSDVIPLSSSVSSSSLSVPSHTTHVVAAALGTVKVREALKYAATEKIDGVGKTAEGGVVHVVTPNWLWCCADRWDWVDERLFQLIETAGSRAGGSGPRDSPEPRLGRGAGSRPGSAKRNGGSKNSGIGRKNSDKHFDCGSKARDPGAVEEDWNSATEALLDSDWSDAPMTLTSEDVTAMSAEVDEEISDDEDDDDDDDDDDDADERNKNDLSRSLKQGDIGPTESSIQLGVITSTDDDAKLRRRVLKRKRNDSEDDNDNDDSEDSDESLGGAEYPHGWKKKLAEEKRRRIEVAEEEGKEEEDEDLTENEIDKREKGYGRVGERDEGEWSEEDEDDFDDSIGSADEEMAAELERRFLSS